ncbi:GNAT family N-acetyltransferase [Joostella sp. CR20]|uniref:GNAT family N-acetyltransferase n=1 Tax=Joostella sp. CR20 TaxID=2804312 RepID=UPI00313E95A4
MSQLYTIKLLSAENIDEIATLTLQLNPTKTKVSLTEMLQKMFDFNGYQCFGFYYNNELVGVCSGWTTIKLYSGKQLELDNVIIDSTYQSKGFGKLFIEEIEKWAKTNQFETIELNTYVANSRSHKFYFNQGFQIIGYHFQKKI